MVRKGLTAWAGVVLVAVGVGVAARADDDFARSGCFLGANGGIAMPTALERNIEHPLVVPGDAMGPRDGGTYLLNPRASADDSLSILGRAGCRGRYVGVEAQFEWLDGFDVDATTGLNSDIPGLAASASFEAWFAGASLKLYPFAGRFQPYAAAGLGYLRVDGSLKAAANLSVPTEVLRIRVHEWDLAARLGGGLEVYLTRNIAVTGDVAYVLPVSDAIEEFEYLSLGGGLLFRF